MWRICVYVANRKQVVHSGRLVNVGGVGYSVTAPHHKIISRQTYKQSIYEWADYLVRFCADGHEPSAFRTRLGEGKVVPLHAIDGAWGERWCRSCTFLTSVLEGVSCQHHAPPALYPRGKSPRYPLYRRLGGPQSRSGRRD
jgi:hypothetical protein